MFRLLAKHSLVLQERKNFHILIQHDDGLLKAATCSCWFVSECKLFSGYVYWFIKVLSRYMVENIEKNN
jgi:hypothetical protein